MVSMKQRVEERDLRLKYLHQIAPNPEIYCASTFGVHTAGDPACDHSWKKIKDEDTYAVWRCEKCAAEAGCDVWD